MCDVIAHVERGSSFQQYRSDDINLTRNRIRRKGDEELSNIMALIMPICVTQFKILTMLLYSDVRKIKAFYTRNVFFYLFMDDLCIYTYGDKPVRVYYIR
jgi:hypothetical protein